MALAVKLSEGLREARMLKACEQVRYEHGRGSFSIFQTFLCQAHRKGRARGFCKVYFISVVS